MNVIPPIPSGGQIQPGGRMIDSEEPVRPTLARSSRFDIADMTPPMQGQQAPFVAPVNEPRLVAVAADNVRGGTERQIARIDVELETLSKRIKEIEKTLEMPASNALMADKPLSTQVDQPARSEAVTSLRVFDGQTNNQPTTAEEVSPISVSEVIPVNVNSDDGAHPEASTTIVAPEAGKGIILSESPDANTYYTGTQVIDEIENRRGGATVKGGAGDSWDSNPQTIEIDAVGVPRLFKTVVLRGYRNQGGWNEDNPTNWVALTLEEEFEHIDDLTMTREQAEEEEYEYCLQATWDYVRAYARPQQT